MLSRPISNWTKRRILFALSLPAVAAFAFPSALMSSPTKRPSTSRLLMSSTPAATTTSWADLQSQIGQTPVGKALNEQVELRKTGKGSPHVQNTKRLFNENKDPPITLYRDHAGWCPYCQKTMLLIEEAEIPIQISLVPMRSYGDKPQSYMRKVPNGLLPAIEVNGQIITESSVIMEYLDQWHQQQDEKAKSMYPRDAQGQQKYRQLAYLERELFSAWCSFMFRPEMPSAGNLLGGLLGGKGDRSPSFQYFLDCFQEVDEALAEHPNTPWFLEYEYPTAIDMLFVSHVERMLASCAYWKGVDLRDASKWKLPNVQRWLDEFDKKEYFLAFKADYYNTVKNIPPQYGPGYDGGIESDRKKFQANILGKDGSWSLPLPHDDPLQPLYRGPPLPLAVLNVAGIMPNNNGSYEDASPKAMQAACRGMAAWKLASNGPNIAAFATRAGANNPRKTFGAELADPYAASNEAWIPTVEAALQVVCQALGDVDNAMPTPEQVALMQSVVPSNQRPMTRECLRYVRDRVGVPRDLPLAAARYLRAYLNWGIDCLE